MHLEVVEAPDGESVVAPQRQARQHRRRARLQCGADGSARAPEFGKGCCGNEVMLLERTVEHHSRMRTRVAHDQPRAGEVRHGEPASVGPGVAWWQGDDDLVAREGRRFRIFVVAAGRDAKVDRPNLHEPPDHRRVRRREFNRHPGQISPGSSEQIGEQTLGDHRAACDAHRGRVATQLHEKVVEECHLIDDTQRGRRQACPGRRRRHARWRAIKQAGAAQRLEVAKSLAQRGLTDAESTRCLADAPGPQGHDERFELAQLGPANGRGARHAQERYSAGRAAGTGPKPGRIGLA